jgi:hypothetical protein
MDAENSIGMVLAIVGIAYLSFVLLWPEKF